MSICRERLRNTANALTFRMSGEQIRLQVLVSSFTSKPGPVGLGFLCVFACHEMADRDGLVVCQEAGPEEQKAREP